MPVIYCKLCSAILKQYFGANVQKVGDSLLETTSRNLSTIVSSTRLLKSEVILALAVLIKFRLVDVEPNQTNENITEYIIRKHSVSLILRYPRYIHLMKTKYGDVGAAIVEEILRSGAQTPNTILYKCFSSNENKDKLITYRDTFVKMIEAEYLTKVIIGKPLENVPENERFIPPVLDLEELKNLQSEKNGYWHVNFKRFHQEFRDGLLISAMENKLGKSAGECLTHMIRLINEKNDTWVVSHSNSLSVGEVKYSLQKTSNNLDLIKYSDQYMSIMADDNLGILRKVAAEQYVIDIKQGFSSLVSCCIEQVINEKLGPKAARIYRVINSKQCVEQDDIQKEAMVPAKEARLLSYKLFEEQFIQIRTLRKTGVGGSNMKSFFLFYICEHQVVKGLLLNCYKALFNANARAAHEKNENKRIIDKSQRLDSIVETMKSRGESQEYIEEILETLTPPEREILANVKARINTLSNSELAVDDTIFLLQMYQHYSSINNKTT